MKNPFDLQDTDSVRFTTSDTLPWTWLTWLPRILARTPAALSISLAATKCPVRWPVGQRHKFSWTRRTSSASSRFITSKTEASTSGGRTSRKRPPRHRFSRLPWTTWRSRKVNERTSSADWSLYPMQRWKSNGSITTSRSKLDPDSSRRTVLVSSPWTLCMPILRILALTPAARRTSSERRLHQQPRLSTVSFYFGYSFIPYTVFFEIIVSFFFHYLLLEPLDLDNDKKTKMLPQPLSIVKIFTIL